MRNLKGVAAAAVAVGVALLLAAPFGRTADPLTAVGSTVIDSTPGVVKEWAIQTFGTSDKLFLSVTLVVVIALLAGLAGALETRRPPIGSLLIAAAGVLGSAAVLARPDGRLVDVVPTLVGAACGVVVLRLLAAKEAKQAATQDDSDTDRSRRLSLVTLAVLGAGAVTGVAGRVLSRQLHSVAGERTAAIVPQAVAPPAPIPPSVQPKGVDLPRFITPNADFYRIDTALVAPQVSRNEWRLRIHGMVDREVSFTFADLASFEVIEKTITLTCVSNPVGGDLISNAVWKGYRTRDLLARAGIRPDSDMVLSTSVDGFTAGTPTEALTDNRDALLAIAMNGEPLPVEHGYPARLVVPGLYGYVSATKWVTDLKLTRFDRDEGYWTPLGWSARGPIKTESRIDVPRSGARIALGPVTFGGVAWAQNRGVKAVEVRIDDGAWAPAELAASYSNDTWRLWSFRWDSLPGSHTMAVRATDNTGATQTSEQATVIPDGATGWHTVSFSAA